jgi:flagellar biosynthesis protein FlhF
MRAKRFQATSVAEAYEQVRQALGDDAVIISTRQAVAPGMFGFGKREFVEVVAGIPDDAAGAAPLRPLVQDAAAHDLVRGLAERAAQRSLDVSLPQEPPRRPSADSPSRLRDAEPALAPPFMNEIAGSALNGPFGALERVLARAAGPELPLPVPDQLATPASPGRDVLSDLATGLQDVRALVERMALARADDSIEHGPAVLADLRARLVAQGVAPAVLLPVLEQVGDALAPNASPEAARQAVERRLAAQLPAPTALDLARRPAVVFIVGPSGAGKTTAAVRLGMQLAQQALRVTIAGTDVDRAGAPQQLQAFGAACGLQTRACYTPGELQALIADGQSDVVIVDTVGHNGTRVERMTELRAFTQVARDPNILLALPATMQADDLLRVTRAYAAVGIRGLLLTRCDETATFGGLITAVKQSGIGVAYTTHHDSVGEPARPGDNHALAASVLLGAWPDRAAAVAWGKRAG